jgi:hypothetical protein
MLVYYLVIQYKSKQTKSKNKNKTKQSKKHTKIRCKCISYCNLVDLLYVGMADVSGPVVFSASKIILKLT